jgi:hypothetical protein
VYEEERRRFAGKIRLISKTQLLTDHTGTVVRRFDLVESAGWRVSSHEGANSGRRS